MKRTMGSRTLALLCAIALLFAFPMSVSAGSQTVSGSWGTSFTWSLTPEGVLTVTGSGPMPEQHRTAAIPWNNYRAAITTVNLNGEITSICDWAFSSCSNLTVISIPYTVATIGECSFLNCTALPRITLPGSLSLIGFRCFEGCTALRSVYIPASVSMVSGCAFQGCTALQSVSGCIGVEEFGSSAFQDCTALSEVSLGNNLLWLGSRAFQGCTALHSITLPASLGTIDSYAFSGSGLRVVTVPGTLRAVESYTFETCENLTSLTLENGIKRIYENAFSGCSSLSSVTVPESVVSIGSGAFSGCSSLSEIVIENPDTEIDEDSFSGCAAPPVKCFSPEWSHSCTLSDSLSLNYYVALEDFDTFERLWLEIDQEIYNGDSRDTVHSVLQNYSVASGETGPILRFSYSGVSAAETVCECSAILYAERDSVLYRSSADFYSIREYAEDMLRSTSDEAMRTLCVDLLNYSAEAQKYFNVKPSELANAGLTQSELALATEAEPQSCAEVIPLEGAAASFLSKSCVLGNSVDLKYYLRLPSGIDPDYTELCFVLQDINGEESVCCVPAADFAYERSTNRYSVKLTDIAAACMGQPVAATILYGGSPISETLVFSVESYCAAIIAGSSNVRLCALCRYMVNYSHGAYAYFSGLYAGTSFSGIQSMECGRLAG